jgi:hypothetical protein
MSRVRQGFSIPTILSQSLNAEYEVGLPVVGMESF